MRQIIDLILTLAEQDIHIYAEAGKLKINSPEGAIDPEIMEKIKTSKAELLAYLISEEGKGSVVIPVAEMEDGYPLSSSQRRLWVISQFDAAHAAYNIPGVFVFEGDLDFSALEQALKTIIIRHESFRTVFKENKQGQLKQFILSEQTMEFKLHHYNWCDKNSGEELVKESIQKDLAKRFDLESGPLWHAALYRVKNNKWIFSYVMHHIISDGWSMGILIRELTQLYNGYVQGKPDTLHPLNIQYKDYAVWQQDQLSEENLQAHKAYWLNQFAGELPVLALAGYRLRPTIKTYNGAALSAGLTAVQSLKIKELCQKHGSTLFMGLLGVVNVLLHKYTGQEDIVTGSPIAGREHADLEGQIGFYVNTLALRTQFKGADNFICLLNNIKQVTLGAYAHQVYPFDELVDALNVHRDLSRNPLFDVQIVLGNIAHDDALQQQELYKLNVRKYDREKNINSRFDLVFNFAEVENILQYSIHYNTDIFDEKTVLQLIAHFKQVVDAIVLDPGKPINELSYLTPAEQQCFITGFNDTVKLFPVNKTLVDLFEDQVKKTPDHLAVVFNNKELTYRELNDRTQCFANYLRSAYGVRQNDIIGIMLERSADMIIALLAVLKSGAAYVPIDLAYPAARKDYIIKDTQLKTLITQTEDQAAVSFNGNLIDIQVLSEIPELLPISDDVSIDPHDLAYVIYTSGSTGTPKGVMIEHASIVNTLYAQQSIFSIQEKERGLQFASLSFDASVSEIFTTIASGATLYIIEEKNKKDPAALEEFIACNKIDFATIPPAYLSLLRIDRITSLRKLITAGETASYETALAFSKFGMYYNAYGPTETSICASIFRLQIGEKLNGSIVPIGKPMWNTSIYILDNYLNMVPVGVAGEIYIGGAGVARGYLNLPELTAEKFIKNPYLINGRLYKTGDMGRWHADGTIEFIGRKDDQVKVRGNRIELAEIEATIQNYSGIDTVVVIVKKIKNENELVAYFVSNNQKITIQDLRIHLKGILPTYMIPDHFIQLPVLPVTINGKVDRKKLPDPHVKIANHKSAYKASSSLTEEILTNIFSEALLIAPSEIDSDNNFFDLGVNSFKLIGISKEINKHFNKKVPLTSLFQYTTIKSLSEFINGENKIPSDNKQEKTQGGWKLNETDQQIAIIGMSGQFPDSKNHQAFWKNIRDGKELLKTFTESELLASGISAAELDDPSFIRRGASLINKDCFDHGFFGYSAEEASLMDPQIRLFHEQCWKALEDAGYSSEIENKKIGLFAGASKNTNWKLYVHGNPEEKPVASFYLDMITDQSFICTLVSYKLNLKGPSIYLDTACSTSLTAVHLACETLLSGKCDMALAGGVTVRTGKKKGYYYREGMISSADGHCRSFDKGSSGTVGGEGAGVVVLKRLSEAIDDGDHIYAVIKSSMSNNDGHDKVGYTAPSVEGQSDCIRIAHKLAGIESSSVSYVEAHGTATHLGDPIEVRALTRAFGLDGSLKQCAIGSVKSNMGHLDSAAGIAGLMKTVLSLHHKQIPASLHFTEANPEIDFASGPFYVNTNLQEWKRTGDHPLRAGVSSFGIGGTNAHVVLEEAPSRPLSEESQGYKLLTLSARSSSSLDRYISDLKNYIEHDPCINLSDMCYSLQVGRKHFSYRKSMVFKNREELLGLLSSTGSLSGLKNKDRSGPLVFMFSGAGSQYVNMGRDLYEGDAFFRKEMDKGFAQLKELTGIHYKEILYPTSEDDKRINEMQHTQPMIFLFGYSLGQLLMSYGFDPSCMIGHSIGEYIAGCLSGVFSYEDALKLVVKRGELMNRMPLGGMLSVSITEAEAQGYLSSRISLAAVNGPEQVVFSGGVRGIEALTAELEQSDASYVRLYASHAGHSYMMDTILEDYRLALESVTMNVAKIPFISNLTGKQIVPEEVASVDYWLRHMRETVRFSEGIKHILSISPNAVFVELGGGHSLTTLVKQHQSLEEATKRVSINLIRHPKEEEDDEGYLMERIGQLWSNGVSVDWKQYYSNEKRLRIPLPTYSFEPVKYPAEVEPTRYRQLLQSSALGQNKELKDWLYYPVWKSTVKLSGSEWEEKTYLFFSSKSVVANAIKAEFSRNNQQSIEVLIGDEFQKISSTQYIVNPLIAGDFEKLFCELRDENTKISDVLYLWSAETTSDQLELTSENIEMNLVYFSVLKIVKELLINKILTGKRFNILTNTLHPVIGNETISYSQSFILGLVNVLPQEYAVSCFNIDIDLKDKPEKLAKDLLNEINGDRNKKDRCIAFRYGQRWVQDYEKNVQPVKSTNRPIKQGGIYLITGGLGKVGSLLAKHLIQNYEAKVIITGRRKMPKELQFNKNEPFSNRFLQLREMSNDVHYCSVDVTDKKEFEKIIQQAERRVGNIDGVIHTAGLIDLNYFELIEDITSEKALQMFLPKVKGLQNIYEIFRERSLDFVWVTSSLASVLGGLSFSSYAAANAFIDYFISSKSIELPNWRSVGLGEMLFSDEEIQKENNASRRALKPTEIIALFEWSLAQDRPLVFETVENLASRIDKVYMQEKGVHLDSDSNSNHSVEKSERPDLNNEYVAPATETEKKLITLIENFFGIKNLGIEDGFFELGGDSLKAMVILKRIRNEFNVTLPLKEFFKSRNIKQVAKEIDAMIWLQVEVKMNNEIII